MKKWSYIIGIDISKLTLDLYYHQGRAHLKVKNSPEGFREILEWCRALGIEPQLAIFAMEITGGYEYRLVQFCHSKNIAFVRIPALAIKRSLGIVRGKNDKVDAARIARYAQEKQDSINASPPLNPAVLELRELLVFRKRIVRETAGYRASISERRHIHGEGKKDLILKSMKQRVEQNQRVVSAVEQKIGDIVSADPAMHLNHRLITSIKGIGDVNAWMIIAYTENFTAFTDARKFAVYAGVVPFDNSSGTSLKGRKKVSKLANREIKQELSQAARSAIQWDTELGLYAERKLRDKPYGVVVNNVRFKLILRVFSIVKKQKPFVDKYKKAA